MNTHTQGPWKIGVRQPTSDKFIYGPQGEEIADCDRKTNFSEENLANARLIAAAPDLLAALKGCADALNEAGKSFALNNPEAVRPNMFEIHAGNARSAIAKAEGREG